MTGQELGQNKLPLAQRAQFLLIFGYRYGLKFKTQVAPYLIYLYKDRLHVFMLYFLRSN